MKVTIINFSNRKGGNSDSISKYLKTLFNEDDNVKIFNLINIEKCGKCNYNCLKEKKCPHEDNITNIYRNICNSDICYFVLPNYCDYPSSNFFIFNERGNGYFNKKEGRLIKYINVKKKFIVITNSNTENFVDIMKNHVNEDPDILFISPKKFGMSSFSDNILNNDKCKILLKDFKEDNYKLEESAMGVVICNNKILATKEDIYNNLVFSLPKGHIENNETHIETAIREVYEETGLKLTKENFAKSLNHYEIKFIDHHHRLIKKYIYPILFKIDNESNLNIKEKRVKEVGFYNIYEFIENCSYENIKSIIIKSLKDL